MYRLLLLLPLLAACGGDTKTETTGATTTTTTTTTTEVDEAQVLADLEADFANYSTWDQATGVEGVFDTPGGMHGEAVQIWYNPTALADLTASADGATAFKEGYTDNTAATLQAITAMTYVDGYGWFYAMFGEDATVMDSGRIDMCIGCHEAGSGGFLAGGM